MSVDEAFIQDILAHPDDLGLRLIYADWLDERNDPRGTFLRAEAEYLALTEDDERRPAVRERLRALARPVDTYWRRRIDLPVIENCSIAFAFECPKKWQTLQETEESSVRYCDECRKNVYYCNTVAEAFDHTGRGHCVAIDTQHERKPGDIEHEIMMGMIADPEPVREPEAWRCGEVVEINRGKYRGNAGHIAKLHLSENRATIRLRLGCQPLFVTVSLDDLEPIE